MHEVAHGDVTVGKLPVMQIWRHGPQHPQEKTEAEV